MPAAFGLYRLIDRQCVEEFICKDDRWPFRHLDYRTVPGNWNPRAFQGLFLLRSQSGTDLDQVDNYCCAKLRHELRRPQCVFQHRAATRAELDQSHILWSSHLFPYGRRPDTDQLAEHLAYLGRGDEITSRAERVVSCVITVVGVEQTEGHVLSDRHWPAQLDPTADFSVQRGVFLH